jgi:hypothetical protein
MTFDNVNTQEGTTDDSRNCEEMDFPNLHSLENCDLLLKLSKDRDWIWRGQSCLSDPTPSIFRSGHLRSTLVWPEDHFCLARQFCLDVGLPGLTGNVGPVELAIARHYGVEVPCLDWTESREIAQFFSIANQDATKCVLFAINRRVAERFHERVREPRNLKQGVTLDDYPSVQMKLKAFRSEEAYSSMVQRLKRMECQKGILMVIWPAGGVGHSLSTLVRGKYRAEWTNSVKDCQSSNNGYVRFAATISKAERVSLLRELHSKEITMRHLFPDEVGLAGYLNMTTRVEGYGGHEPLARAHKSLH